MISIKQLNFHFNINIVHFLYFCIFKNNKNTLIQLVNLTIIKNILLKNLLFLNL